MDIQPDTHVKGSPQHDDDRRYHDLIASVDGIVWEVDLRTFQFTFVSQQAERLLGYSLPQWYTPGFWVDHLHPDDRAWAPEFCLRAARERRDHNFEYRMLAADGRTVWLHDIVNVIIEGGEAVMLRGIMVDITDRKRAEGERQAHLWLLESLDRVNRAIQGTSDLNQMMSDVLDTVLTIFDCDRAWLIHPCDPEAATCSVAMERTRPEYPGAGEPPFASAVDSEIADVFRTVRGVGSPVRFGPGSDHQVPPATATRFSIRSQLATAVYPKTGQPYMFGLHQCSRPRDWTPEEVRLFQEVGWRLADALTSLLVLRSLQDREQKLDASQRLAHIGYWDYDLDANRVSLSDEAKRIFGLSPEEPVVDFTSWQVRWPKLVHPEDLPRVLQSASDAIHSNHGFDHEYRVVRPDGEVRVVHSRADVTLHESGRPRRMFGTVQDITDRKQTEYKLSLFRSLIDRANDAIEAIDPETGRILDVNEKACQLHGYSREEYLTLAVYDVIAHMDREGWERRRQELRRIGSDVVETTHRRKDGSLVPVEVNVAHVTLDRDYLIAVVRDITERKQAERALMESHNLLNGVVEGTSDAVFVKDLDGRYLMMNSAGARFHGRTVDEMIGKTGGDLFTPETAHSIMEHDREVMETGSHVVEEVFTTAGVARTFLTTKTRYHDAQGRVIGLIGIARDVTELKQLEGQLRQAQKMEAVGRLAGGVAHDFNNILTVINGNSELLARSLRADDPDRELLLELQKSGRRAAELTSQLLAFGRQQILQPGVISLNALLGNLCTLLQRLIGEDVELTLVPDAGLELATVDPTLFEQAIINLAVNARDAMPSGGRLTIETSNVELDATFSAGHPGVRPGRYILVTVSDSGHGMDEATQANIFEPFFTTKSPGKGTGLGLAMVYGFVKQSGGYVCVESAPDRGTTFRMYLPQAEKTAPPAERSSPESVVEVPKGSETILVVEDDDLVRHLALRVLQSSGYDVLDAQSGEDAISVARRHQGPIHLVLTDVVMPGMSGPLLGKAVVAVRPNVAVLFMSGYTDEAVLRGGKVKSGAAFLQKPFSPLALTRKVREVLDARAGRREGI